MRKHRVFLVAVAAFCVTACNTSSPEKYFNLAVLNCNMMHGFADNGLQRELESPSLSMINGDKNNFAPMKREDVLDNKIQNITSNLAKLKKLDKTKETKELLQASVSLYEYVLPVYENEYRELARLYDDGASQESITHFAETIHNKYYPEYTELLEKLIAAGRPYAEKHNIRVNWDVRTSPN